jgi:hypothetical protein
MWAEFTIVGVAFLVVVSAVCGIFAMMAYGVELLVSQFVTWYTPRKPLTASPKAPLTEPIPESEAQPRPSLVEVAPEPDSFSSLSW